MGELLLDISYVHFVTPLFWHDSAWLGQVFGRMKEAGLGSALSYIKQLEQPRVKVASPTQLLSESTAWEADSYLFSSIPDEAAPITLKLGVFPGRLRMVVKLCGEGLAQHRQDGLKILTALMVGLHQDLGGSALFGHQLCIRPIGGGYRRPRPPREGGYWLLGTLVDFVSKSFHRQHAHGDPGALQRLLESPMPEGAEREDLGDLVIFRWAHSLEDDEVARARSQQEAWISQVLDLPIDSGFNSLGDQLVSSYGLVAHDPLTLYSTMQQHGFKAVVVGAGGEVDEDLFQEMAGWVAAGQLPDGTPLRRMGLLVPSRDAALRVRERANLARIDDVLYIGEDRHWWNPFPPGHWLEMF